MMISWRSAGFVLLAALLVAMAYSGSGQVTFERLTLGNARNAPDPLNSGTIPGVGSVGYIERIAKHEVTDAQHAEVLNKVDAAGSNPNAVYNASTRSDARGGISLDADATGVGNRRAEAGKSEDAVPEGLSDSDWKNIRQEYERHRHAAVAVDGEFRACNPGQQWQTDFDGRGFTVEPKGAGWRWGLELQSYGFPGYERAVSGQAKMTAQNDRVTYDWDAGLREWFVNGRGGLEHRFTLASRPPGATDPQLGPGDPRLGAGEWLELRLAVRGGLRAQVHADGRGVSFVDEQGHPVVVYAGLRVWDADHRELPARIDADATGLRLAVDHRDARYPLTIDPIAQQAYLKASNIGAYDFFGNSVAVSGDTVVVGAPSEDSNATGVNGNDADNSAFRSGAAYVFVRDGGGVWSQQAYLKASNNDGGNPFGIIDQFGFSVAVSGDTVVVGAVTESSNATGVNGNQADNSALHSGAAYVFVRDGGAWSQQAYLKASNTDGIDPTDPSSSGDGFGFSVAVSGDTIVVGAVQEDSNAMGVNRNQADNSAIDSGAAYAFVRGGDGVWSQQAYLKASNTGADDSFGFSVAVSGDTVVVGADLEDSNATGVNGNQADNSLNGPGAAYVFVRDGFGVWSQQAYLKASNTDAFVEFGISVAVSGDTVVVGAPGESSNATGVNGNQDNNSATASGAAYVFVRDGFGVWSQQAYLKASNTDSGDLFGFPVAVSGDTVVVGARGEDSNATGVNGNQGNDFNTPSTGAAYVFVIPTNSDCGNGVVDVDELCDDGFTDACGNCNATCSGVGSGSTCGDGSGCPEFEACDDGNSNNGDCCSSTCQLEPLGSPCDDGWFCTLTDTCSIGTCVGSGFRCGENQLCDEANDACTDVTSCTTDADCPDDLVFCNGIETCVGARCVRSGDPCGGTACNTCQETTDSCFDLFGTACGDQTDNECNNPATCDGVGTCLDNFEPEGSPCNDGSFCSIGDVCQAGVCGGTSSPCLAGEFCDETTSGCVQCAADAHCSDGSFCNGTEICANGLCIAGSPACAVGECCNEAFGCSVCCTSDELCVNGLFCEGDETCDLVTGQCVPGAPPCDPTIPCDESIDQCVECTNDEACGDGLVCNGLETCNLTTLRCEPGTGLGCVFGSACVEPFGECDDDADDDGIVNLQDNCRFTPNGRWAGHVSRACSSRHVWQTWLAIRLQEAATVCVVSIRRTRTKTAWAMHAIQTTIMTTGPTRETTARSCPIRASSARTRWRAVGSPRDSSGRWTRIVTGLVTPATTAPRTRTPPRRTLTEMGSAICATCALGLMIGWTVTPTARLTAVIQTTTTTACPMRRTTVGAGRTRW